MVLGIIIGIFAGIVAIIKFGVGIIKFGVDWTIDKFRFVSDCIKQDNENKDNIKSFFNKKRHYLKLNDEL